MTPYLRARVTYTVCCALLAAPALARASSHREAPLITEDPVADTTDVYAFVDPQMPSKVVIVANWVPFEEPAGGPNFFGFGEDLLYYIYVDNDGDAKPEIGYQFTFDTTVANPDTFAYNLGPVDALDDPDWNVRQTYTVERRQGGEGEILGSGLASPPVHVGPRSTPDYDALAAAAVHTLPGDIEVFAGQRDDPFFGDLGAVFDLLGLRPLNGAHAIPLPTAAGVDALSGFNVHTIAMRIPIDHLVSRFTHDPVIGVYSLTYRRKMRTLRPGRTPRSRGPYVRVSRLGMPLVNEVVVPLGAKDRFNASRPQEDAQFLSFVRNPGVVDLLPVLYPNVFACAPSAPRDDLVAVFLTGVAGLNQPQDLSAPSEMIRLNTSVAPTALGARDRLGLLAGQEDGFPNGRRLEDDVVDVALRALAGGTPFGDCAGISPNQDLGDGVDANDRPFLTHFPYVATPHSGYEHVHHGGGVASPSGAFVR